jgi:hypothetical protein
VVILSNYSSEYTYLLALINSYVFIMTLQIYPVSWVAGHCKRSALEVMNMKQMRDSALDSAMNQTFGNTAAGKAVPYLSYALAIRNFSDNPAQAMLIEAANDEFLRSVA